MGYYWFDQGVLEADEPERVPQGPGLRLMSGPGNCPYPYIATNLASISVSMLRNQPRTPAAKPTAATSRHFNSTIQSNPSSNTKHHEERGVQV